MAVQPFFVSDRNVSFILETVSVKALGAFDMTSLHAALQPAAGG